MTNISSSDAFGILGKWRDGMSQLHLSMRKADGSMDGTPASIICLSDSEESVVAEIAVSEQKENHPSTFEKHFSRPENLAFLPCSQNLAKGSGYPT
jgi:hypothetical protein